MYCYLTKILKIFTYIILFADHQFFDYFFYLHFLKLITSFIHQKQQQKQGVNDVTLCEKCVSAYHLVGSIFIL